MATQRVSPTILPTVPIVAALSLVVFALFGLVFARTTIAPITFFEPATVVVCLLSDLATAALLFASLRASARRSTLVLVAGFTGSALVLGLFLALQGWTPNEPPLIVAGTQSAPWLFVFWHLLGALLGVIFVAARAFDGARLPSLRTSLVRVGVLLVLVVGGVLAIALRADALLPAIMRGSSLEPLRTSGVGAATLVALGASIALLWGRAGENERARALGLALFAMLLAFSIGVYGNASAGSLASYVQALLYVVASVAILSAAVRELLADSDRLDKTEEELVQHTQRLAAMWEIAIDATLDETARFQAMLDAGARAIQPDHAFYGHVGHLEGDEIVVDAVVRRPGLTSDALDLVDRLSPGTRFPMRDGMHADMHASKVTCAWNDLRNDATTERRKRAWELGIRSVIGTSFRVAGTDYFIVYASRVPVQRAFTHEDRIFVEVLASFFAARLHQRSQQDRIQYQSEIDELTGLRNRTAFRTATVKHLRERLRDGVGCALAVIDFDRFREINDTLGHQIGDAVLAQFGTALAAFAGTTDIAARLGGDNFALLFDAVESREAVDERARGILAIFERQFLAGATPNERLAASGSIGLALFPEDGRTFEELLAHADAAVDVAKRGERGTLAFFDRDIGSALERRRALRNDLAVAVSAGQLVLHYQPVVTLRDSRVTGFEALVRWNHPKNGQMAPDDFIPFAEENGSISEIGEWVLQQTARDVLTLGPAAAGLRAFVNLSPHQLSDLSFVTTVHDLIARHPSLRGNLGFEITENVALSEGGTAFRALELIRNMELPIAIDDFGTGYSSLSYLKRLPIDIIKIDRSFVAGLPADESDTALIETQLRIAAQFGYETLAEGVETEEQLLWLRALGCASAQGFHIARPMPFDELVAWLTRRERGISAVRRTA